MLQIATCEDLEEEANGLSASLEVLLDKRQLPHVISLFSSGEELIAALEGGLQFDLCLLDIYLAGLNGVDAARRVKELAPSIQVAFTTSSREFAVETFDLDAVYYLVKPVTEEKLRTLVERFLRRQKKPVTKLTITTPVKDYVFPLQRVVKIQSNNKGVDIYLHGEPQPQRIPPLLRPGGGAAGRGALFAHLPGLYRTDGRHPPAGRGRVPAEGRHQRPHQPPGAQGDPPPLQRLPVLEAINPRRKKRRARYDAAAVPR